MKCPMLNVPSDASVRLAWDGVAWCVSITRLGSPSTLHACMRNPGLCGVISHDPGVSWPDRKGVALVNGLLAQPEAAAFLLFATNADAVACWWRLNGGTQ